MTYDEISDYIEQRMDQVDPKLLKQLKWIIKDGVEGDMESIFLATTTRYNPPLIIFYPEAMLKSHKDKIDIDGIIQHEVIHACFRGDERQAYNKQGKINVFK